MTDEEKKEFKGAARFADTVDTAKTFSNVEGYGVCSKCSNFSLVEYENGHRTFAFCVHHRWENPKRLSSSYRITRCSDFYKRGSLSLEAMWLMARKIDADNKKQIGFNLNEVADAEEIDLELLRYDMEDE
jgi:hypothetical protein